MGVFLVDRVLNYSYFFFQQSQHLPQLLYLRGKDRFSIVFGRSWRCIFLARIFVRVGVTALVLFLLFGVLIDHLFEQMEQSFDGHGSAVAESADILKGNAEPQFAEHFI